MKLRAHLTLAGLLISAQTSAQTPAKVEIVLANFSFTPSNIALKAGQPVTLHFVNQGLGGHNFTAPEFFNTSSMDALTRAKLTKKGSIELSAGQSADVTVTPKSGTYKVKCGHFLHAGFGMTGTISVS